MKKNIFLLFALALLSFSSNQLLAQSTPDSIQKASPEKLAVMQANYLKEKISLTPDQYPKVVELFKKYNKKTDDTFKSNMLISSKIQIVRDTNKDKEVQLQKLLTADQNKQFQDIRDEFTTKFKQRPSMPGK